MHVAVGAGQVVVPHAGTQAGLVGKAAGMQQQLAVVVKRWPQACTSVKVSVPQDVCARPAHAGAALPLLER